MTEDVHDSFHEDERLVVLDTGNKAMIIRIKDSAVVENFLSYKLDFLYRIRERYSWIQTTIFRKILWASAYKT